MVVKVLINTSVKTLNKVFDYLVPMDLENDIEIGKRVAVSFGRSKNQEEGIIVKIIDDEDYESKGYELKEISSVLDEYSYIDEDKLSLAKYISHIYFCNVYDALKLMLPPGTGSKNSSKSLKTKKNKRVLLNYSTEEIESFIEDGKITSANHIRLLRFLAQNDFVLIDDIVEGLSISKNIVNTLEKNGYIRYEEIEIQNEVFDNLDLKSKYDKKELTEEQAEAVSKISRSIINNEHKEFLLYGVTGSGKTEVYLELIEKTINQGRKAIMLIPEISLTHQTLARFVARFGDNIAVINSKMTISQRKDEYKKIKGGKVNIVIGARSAIFSPIDNLGIVIIDEAHDSSYYSSTTPKYSTKEVASFICKKTDAVLVLGSATPEVTDYYKSSVNKEKLERVELLNRPGESTLPEIITIDMKNEKVIGNVSLFSNRLKEEIESNIKNKKKTMIFLNRRGYTSYLTCKNCSHIFKCPNCDVALVYHKKNDLLLCHYCNHVEKNVRTCPKCGSDHISSGSIGTQKVEEELRELFPMIKVLRMDADTTVAKNSHQKILDKFRNEDIDVLIGTQMIAKGHDISDVTLVGILGVDSLLNMNDYLASEKAFQNIYQVAGRAGRGKYSGKVIIQTNDTNNHVIESIINNSYVDFYNLEIDFRKMFQYPPFMDLVLFELSSKDLNLLKKECEILYNILSEEKSGIYKVYSPKSPFVQRINNRYRMNILLKSKLNSESYNLIYSKIKKYKKIKNKNVNFVVSKNPNSY